MDRPAGNVRKRLTGTFAAERMLAEQRSTPAKPAEAGSDLAGRGGPPSSDQYYQYAAHCSFGSRAHFYGQSDLIRQPINVDPFKAICLRCLV